MDQTPVRNKLLLKTKSITIPPSPQMQKLGYGTGVTVYKFERTENKSPWVLKKVSRKIKRAITEEISERLNFEASVLKKLKHPNIVGFRALFKDKNGRSLIAMEDCNISLGDLIEKRVDDDNNTPFPPNEIQVVMKDVAEGLKYLHHEALVLHCDIKSYNILVKNKFEICKICDFGVSMPLKEDGTLDYTKTVEEPEFVGTEAWCAPEILQIGQVITVKADIFAYGLCLWEMIALEPPYASEMNESDENSIIDLDKSGNLDSSLKVKQRPKIPCEYLDDRYLGILQVYYLCTEQDYKQRPNAHDLCMVIKELNSVDLNK